MEEETGNECLINPEPQATEQPTNPQPTTQPNPEPKQEATKPPKQEEKKMSEADLIKFSVEELQAALEAKKAEEAKPKFVLDENDPSNLAKFCKWQDEEHPLAAALRKTLDSDGDVRSVIKYPGKLTKFCWMYTKDNKRTTNKDECDTARIVSVHEDYVINVRASSLRLDMVLEKI